MKKKYLFIALSLTLIFSFSALPSFASSSDMVDLSDYLIDFNVEKEVSVLNLSCPRSVYTPVTSMTFDFSHPIYTNNYTAVYAVDIPRTTIQFAEEFTGSVTAFGRYILYGQLKLQVGDNSFIPVISQNVQLSVNNNNQYDNIPRWTYSGGSVVFEFDLSDFALEKYEIVSFSIYSQFLNIRADNTQYSFWIRNQVTDFYAAPFNGADIVDSIVGTIDNQTNAIIDATVPGFDDSINDYNDSMADFDGEIDDLLDSATAPDWSSVGDNINSFRNGIILWSQSFMTLFNSFGSKFFSVWQFLVILGAAVGLFGLLGKVIGLTSSYRDV